MRCPAALLRFTLARFAAATMVAAAAAGFGLAALPAAAATATVTPAAVAEVALELSEGRLIRLAGPATSVFIANPEIADINVKSPRLIYVFGKRPGQTTLYAVDGGENVIANLRVVVSHNVTRLNGALARLLPGAEVAATSVDGGIVLEGAVGAAADAENARRLAARYLGAEEEVINRLAVTAPNQINLRVRVAEVSRQIVNQFGFNWETAINGDILFGIATGSPVSLGSLAGANTISPIVSDSVNGVLTAGQPVPSVPFLTRQGGVSNAFLGAQSGAVDLNLLIDALAEDGLITVLAEPNLTAISGETASFLAGGEFPIPVPQGQDQITIQFKKFGVSLAFTPTYLDGGRISMRVRPEVSQLSNNGAVTLNQFFVPALSTRRAETTVELGSGQSFAIAGLILNNSLHDIDKIPGLADIPILGQLFRSDRFERNESELMIIVTPYIVRPVDTPGRLALPTDGYHAPVETAAIPRPRTGSARRLPALGQSELLGPAGFVID